MFRALILLLSIALATGPALSQSQPFTDAQGNRYTGYVLMCWTGTTFAPCTASTAIPVTGGSSTIGGNASLSVTSTTGNVALPVSTSTYPTVLLSNDGPNEIFFNLGTSGVTATTSNVPIASGNAICVQIGAGNTNVAAITSSGLATLRVIQLTACPVIAQGTSTVSINLGSAATAIATGSTGAVTATLAATTSKTTYICGFDVSAAGGTATISPITVTGLLGGTFTYQGLSSGGSPFSKTYTPCVPASAQNQSIAVVTTADGTATAVDVQAWGYQQ